jgi:minor extracellular serine protease Vpr
MLYSSTESRPTSMKSFVLMIAALAVCVAPSFAAEGSAHKTPFYRPHLSRRVSPAQPHLTGDAVIVNAASYESGISPGGLATIFGYNLTMVTGTVLAGSNPLPTRLAGVEVLVSGFPAPIYGIAYAGGGQDQISIQVPYEAPTGPGAAEIQVFDEGALVADFFTDSFTEDPGIFTYNGNFAIAEASDYSLIGPNNPAIPGEPLVLYVTGLGPLTLDLLDGYGSPTTPPFAQTIDPFQVVLDGEDCKVFFSGLAPGFVGLYQINFNVPSDAAAGNLQIFIQSPYANSASATLPVR